MYKLGLLLRTLKRGNLKMAWFVITHSIPGLWSHTCHQCGEYKPLNLYIRCHACTWSNIQKALRADK